MRIVDAFVGTDPGPRREINEDGAAWLPHLHALAVVDGMGGPGVGDRAAASALALLAEREAALGRYAEGVDEDTSAVARLALASAMERLLVDIHRRIKSDGLRVGQLGMGAAMTLALVSGGRLFLAHAGNVRAYLYRGGRLKQLTEDHTVAAAKFRHGRLSRAEARISAERFALFQALGQGAQVEVDTAEAALADDDLVLLCSDGVHGVLDDGELAGCVGHGTAEQIGRRIMEAAARAGGSDNLSVAVMRLQGDRSIAEIEMVAQILEEVFLFRVLEESERRMVAPYLDERRLRAGEVLFRQGDPADAFYVLLQGGVRITVGDTPLLDVGPGGHFGELCLAREASRSATVTALRDSRLLSLRADHFREVVNSRQRIGASLALAMVDYLGDRLRDLTQRVNRVETVVRTGPPNGLDLDVAVLLAARGELD